MIRTGRKNHFQSDQGSVVDKLDEIIGIEIILDGKARLKKYHQPSHFADRLDLKDKVEKLYVKRTKNDNEKTIIMAVIILIG